STAGNTSSTGLYVAGHEPRNDNLMPGDVYRDLSGTGINFNAAAQDPTPHTFQADLAYDGDTLTETLTDLATGASVGRSYQVNIPLQVGANTAYVGFTAGSTGAQRATQDVLTWQFNPSTGGPIDHSDGFADHGDVQSNGDALFPTTAP